jgi:tetratricopeptide (TPR) repeat protein
MFLEAIDRYNKTLEFLPPGSETAAIVYYNLGNSHAYISDWNKARDYYLMGIKIIEPKRESTLLADNYRNMGYLPVNYREADLWYEKSIMVSKRIGYQGGEVEALFNLAEVYYKRGEYARALRRYQEARGIYERGRNKEGEALVNDSLARTYSALGEYKDALGAREKAFTIYKLLGDKIGEASCIVTLAEIHKRQGKFEEAYKAYQEALKLYEEQEDFKGKASVLKGLGEMYEAQGKTEEALSHCLRSMRAYKEIGEKRGSVEVLNHVAGMYFLQGKADDALRHSQEALRLSDELDYPEGKKQSFFNIMRAFWLLNQWKEAGRTAENAWKIGEELLWKKQEKARLENILGAYYCRSALEGGGPIYKDQFNKGLFYCEDARDIYRELNDKEGEADTLYLIGGLRLTFGEYEEARKSYEASIKLCQELGTLSKEALAINGIANIYYYQARDEIAKGYDAQGLLEKAFNTSQRAYTMLQETGDQKNQKMIIENMNSIRQTIRENYDVEYIAKKKEIERIKGKLAKMEEETQRKDASQKEVGNLFTAVLQSFFTP